MSITRVNDNRPNHQLDDLDDNSASTRFGNINIASVNNTDRVNILKHKTPNPDKTEQGYLKKQKTKKTA